MRYYNEELPCKLSPNTNENKLSTFVKVLSITYNRNLVPFFQWWKFPVLADTIEATKDLPEWKGIIHRLETAKETICPSGSISNCCTDDHPCQVGRGDCDSDSNCVGDLRCGSNNCPRSNSTWVTVFLDDNDCCYDPKNEVCDGTGENSGSCCTKDFPCKAGEGDCDSDSDCVGDLVCGSNNCKGEAFLDDDDCCYKP